MIIWTEKNEMSANWWKNTKENTLNRTVIAWHCNTSPMVAYDVKQRKTSPAVLCLYLPMKKKLWAKSQHQSVFNLWSNRINVGRNHHVKSISGLYMCVCNLYMYHWYLVRSVVFYIQIGIYGKQTFASSSLFLLSYLRMRSAKAIKYYFQLILRHQLTHNSTHKTTKPTQKALRSMWKQFVIITWWPLVKRFELTYVLIFCRCCFWFKRDLFVTLLWSCLLPEPVSKENSAH